MFRLILFLTILRATVATPLLGDEPARVAVENAHIELWKRFIDRHGIMVDFTDLDGKVNYPTPEECLEGKPNALGWFQPIENGAMFNGMYLDAAINRWRHTRSPDDATKARRLMEGLLLLNSISDVPGFVGRGVSTDGKSHYPMGSNDQTAPWFYGLWRYWESELATPSEKALIQQHLVKTAESIRRLNWQIPAEPPFNTRGSFEGFHFEEVSRKLFVLKLLYKVTNDAIWNEFYRAELTQRGGAHQLTKQEICRNGMKFFYAKTHNWTSCVGVAALRGLWELESDQTIRDDYAKGLTASAELAAESLSLGQKFNSLDHLNFSQDWRTPMLPLWYPQKNEGEAVALALEQLKAFAKLSPQRGSETAFIREPVSAAWIVALCPDANVVDKYDATIRQVIAHYDYSRLYYCTFFWVECAWWRLPGEQTSNPRRQ